MIEIRIMKVISILMLFCPYPIIHVAGAITDTDETYGAYGAAVNIIIRPII